MNKTPTPNNDFDLEGLKTDFPTATELEKFVYDQTDVILNLKGRSNEMKYKVALAVLNGEEVDPKYIGSVNPYVNKNDLVPEDPLKPVPARDKRLPDFKTIAHSFYTPAFPHSDKESKSRGQKLQVQFRKYRNGAISAEVLGPIEPRPEGKIIDKYGKERPEVIRWVDPRTGEQCLKTAAGELTELGIRMKAQFELKNSPLFGLWFRVDRNVVSSDRSIIDDPWGSN